MFQTKKEVVDEYKVLKRKPNSEEALKILKKLVSQVKPIITKRNWHVRYLCEFFPKNPNLLGTNVNRGYKINLRLRPHFDDSIFLEYNDILGTLLHELVHIVRGPHDEQFYKLLNELKAETEELMASGYSGEGFYSNGQRLGSLSVPLYKSSQAAAAAAEKRRRLDKIMLPKGGVRLGPPASPTAHLTPAQMAASAAERRLRDKVWCGGSISIEDDDEDEDEDDQQTGSKRKPINQPESSSSGSKRVKARDQNIIDLTNNDIIDATNQKKEIKQQDGWVCSACTFLNGSIVLVCEVCLTERPVIKEDTTNDDDTWLCPQCTLSNGNEWSVCNACQYVYLR